MKDVGLSNSPAAAREFEATDEQLSAELKKWTGTAPALQPVGELLDRHWEAAFAYARLCTDGARNAGMLTSAAFTRLFGESLRQNGPTSAWRPALLVTVGRVAAEWDGDGRREMLHPDLRSAAGEDERLAARLLPPPHRRLLAEAFQRLPQPARCLVWHTEVEAEPLGVPARLLGLDVESADVELARARERLREECLQVHRELAPEQECRRYLRMLDVTYRRGGVHIDVDLAGHLSRCTHCRDTADQLSRFEEGLGLSLAEAVLGWGARGYVEFRAERDVRAAAEESRPPEFPGESFTSPEPAVPAPPSAPPARSGPPARPGPAPGPRTGRRAAARRATRRAARRAAARRRNLAVAVVTVSGLVVLPLVLWSVLGSWDGTAPSGGVRPSRSPGTGGKSATEAPSWAGAGSSADGTVRGRLHNVGSGLCVAVVGAKTVAGAETRLAKCSSAPGQQWSYATDGLLRSGADPGLCLDSRLGYSVRLTPCTGESAESGRDIRYDFTLRGTIVPGWDQDLALAPAATDGSGALVVKTREDSDAQRWAFDTSKTDLQMEAVDWDADGSPGPVRTPAPRTPTAPAPAPASSTTPSASPTTAQPSPSAPPSAPVPDGPGGRGGWGSGGGYGGGGGRH
ncbi:ricin-type beta-trefoil lectin domain protein [Streptomyces sp. NPDC000987]|uniref:ricin-type beta-trefoil lectin domain protein n=1 Tax=Streptomyces sp. NPDC000987 TaxID=3154374 RepID=UPI0033349EC4